MDKNSRYGYWGKILHVDLTSCSWHVESLNENWYRTYAGGGLMGTWFMLKQTPAGIDPFSPENLLCFMSSVVAGLEAPGLARFSIVSKSPLSGGIAESRCEGGFGRRLKARVDQPLGRTSSNPLPHDRLRKKFELCAARVLGQGAIAAAGDAIERIETLADVREITRHLGA